MVLSAGIVNIDKGVPVRLGASEAHLDFLIAEELANNRPFAAHLAGLDPASADDLSVTCRFNVWDPGCCPDHAGENDVDVTIEHAGQEMRLLIEDKIWAVFQPEQARRSRARADKHKVRVHARLVRA